MTHEVPEYRKAFGATHTSASGATQPVYEHMLKLRLRKEHKMQFPFAARPRAGQIVQMIADLAMGVYEYNPERGIVQPMVLEDAVRRGMNEFNFYKPRDWDGGKDVEEFQAMKEVIPIMAQHAFDGLMEQYALVADFEGEFQRWHHDPRIDVPTMLFCDYTGGGWQTDLKCSFPLRNPPRKDGTRTWRAPAPRTAPTEQQLMQQAVYYKATGLRPSLLYVTPKGYNLVTEAEAPELKADNLEIVFEQVVQRWMVHQNLFKAAEGSWNKLFGMVVPNYAEISTRHGPEILNIAKNVWRI